MDRIWEHIRLGPMTSGARRGLLYLVVLSILVDFGMYLLLTRSVHQLSTQQHAQCKFYDDLGSAPLTLGPNGKASMLGVQIVSDARVAWHEGGCPGAQQPPDPSFTKWAAYYRLPVN